MKEPDPKLEPDFDYENISTEIREQPSILYERPQAKHVFIVLFLVLLALFSSIIYWLSNHYSDLLWVSRDAIFINHEYWRLFTALFTHADLKHLLSNLPLFLAFGWFLRTYFGLLAFPIAALLVGAFANLATIYFYEPHIRLIGASGMVYGLVGLWVILYMRYEVRYSFAMKIFRALGVSMILLLPTTYSATTSYLAHAFGFLFGILFAFFLIITGIHDKKQRELQKAHEINENQ